MTAEKLYTGLLAMDEEQWGLLFPSEELYDSACELLSETDFAKPLKELGETKAKLYEAFGIELKPKQVEEKKEETKEETIKA